MIICSLFNINVMHILPDLSLKLVLAAITLLAVVREGKAKPWRPRPSAPAAGQYCQGCPFPASCSDVPANLPGYFILLTGQLVYCGDYPGHATHHGAHYHGGTTMYGAGYGCGDTQVVDDGDSHVVVDDGDTQIVDGGDTHIDGGDTQIVDGGDYIQIVDGGDTHIDDGDTQIVDGGDYTQIVDGGDTHTHDGDTEIVDGGDYTQIVDGGDTQIVDGGDYTQIVDGGDTQIIVDGGDTHDCECETHDGGDTQIVVDGGETHIVDGGDTQIIEGGETHIVEGGDTQIIEGGETHIVEGGDTQIIEGGETHVVDGGDTHGGDTQIIVDGGGGCGGCGGNGWTKVADVNMSDPTHNCPTGFILQESVGKRGCTRSYTHRHEGSITQTSFDCKGNSYSEVCGRVIAYGAGGLKAFGTKYRGEEHRKNIDSYYVDGVSITCGTPREHIWTYAAGYLDTHQATVEEQEFQCPCSTDGIRELVPDFVGEDYTCESARNQKASSIVYADFLYNDKLWDGKNLGPLEANCKKPCQYFYKRLKSATTRNIDVRLCNAEESHKQEIYITIIELFIK